MIYLELILGFLEVGCFSFGGAYSAIPLIRDVVLSYSWLSDETMTYMIAVAESTPGPIMVNLATFVGNAQGGLLGAILATTAVVLPSFFAILLIMNLLRNLLFQLRNMRDNTNGATIAAQAHQRLDGSAKGVTIQRAKAFIDKHGFNYDTSGIHLHHICKAKGQSKSRLKGFAAGKGRGWANFSAELIQDLQIQTGRSTEFFPIFLSAQNISSAGQHIQTAVGVRNDGIEIKAQNISLKIDAFVIGPACGFVKVIYLTEMLLCCFNFAVN